MNADPAGQGRANWRGEVTFLAWAIVLLYAALDLALYLSFHHRPAGASARTAVYLLSLGEAGMICIAGGIFIRLHYPQAESGGPQPGRARRLAVVVAVIVLFSVVRFGVPWLALGSAR